MMRPTAGEDHGRAACTASGGWGRRGSRGCGIRRTPTPAQTKYTRGSCPQNFFQATALWIGVQLAWTSMYVLPGTPGRSGVVP
jgi:hypothetical protein